LPYDPDGARRLLAQAGYPHGLGFPPLEALAPARGPVVATIEYLRAQWLENLGVEVTWKQMDWGRYLDRLQREAPPQLWVMGWSADYPDPDNFLRTSEWTVTGRWQNDSFAGLVEHARRVMDQRERMRMYQQADQILVEEAPILPLLHYRFHLLVKPWVRKLPTSPIRGWFWKDVIIEPH